MTSNTNSVSKDVFLPKYSVLSILKFLLKLCTRINYDNLLTTLPPLRLWGITMAWSLDGLDPNLCHKSKTVFVIFMAVPTGEGLFFLRRCLLVKTNIILYFCVIILVQNMLKYSCVNSFVLV